jgi:phospholipid transport system substrate-binding protein
MKNIIFLITVLVGLGLGGSQAARAAEGAPEAKATEAPPQQFSGEQLKIKSYMEELFEASKTVNRPPEQVGKSRAKIEGAFEWERVAQDCIGKKQWGKLSASQRTQFKSMLHDVMVKTAFSRMDTFWDKTTYQFDKIQVNKDNTALVVSKFIVSNDSFGLEYYLFKKNGRWYVYDISYEGLRYSVNINEQITAFLKEKSFSGLMEKLKKRRDELDSDAKKS